MTKQRLANQWRCIKSNKMKVRRRTSVPHFFLRAAYLKAATARLQREKGRERAGPQSWARRRRRRKKKKSWKQQLRSSAAYTHPYFTPTEVHHKSCETRQKKQIKNNNNNILSQDWLRVLWGARTYGTFSNTAKVYDIRGTNKKRHTKKKKITTKKNSTNPEASK